MARNKYLTAPVPTTEMPKGIPYIVANEAAERFSFYGMKGILVVFMTQYLMGSDGELAVMSDDDAKTWYHLFVSAVYFLPVAGALVADVFLGKYRTIMILSVVYCLGHLSLAFDETKVGLFLGLALISIGSGGIKPCVSAHVGDQFGRTNADLLKKVFAWFYFSINLGAFASTLLTPKLLVWYGPGVAFGVPGVLMGVATLAFWMGRRKFIHIPPGGWGFIKETFSGAGLSAALRLSIIYAFVAMFWALFDQTGSAWILQAEKMDRRLLDIHWGWINLTWDLEASQIQAANPLLVMILIPVFAYGVYPVVNRVFPLTPLRKISIGMFVAVGSFIVPAFIEYMIDAGQTPHVGWQLFAYVIITCAEVMVSITCLEFSYTQAPKKMKSFIMAMYLASVSLGNLFTAAVNLFIQNPDGTSKLTGAAYYWFFAGTMLATALAFVVVALLFKERTYIQDEVEDKA